MSVARTPEHRLTRAARPRFFRAYTGALELGGGRAAMRRVLKVLAARQAEIARTPGGSRSLNPATGA